MTDGVNELGLQAAGKRQRPSVPRWSGRNAYSYFVALAKFTLPVLAILLAALIVFWNQLVPNARLLTPEISSLAPEMADNVEMMNPRYEGLDEKNRPFVLTAEKAAQVDQRAQVIDLAHPQAKVTLEDGAGLVVSADMGRYNRRREILFLDGNVKVVHDNGFTLDTPYAQVHFKRGMARGDKGVSGAGPSGFLEAEGFEFRNEGRDILFTGKTYLLVKPASKDPTAKDG